MATYTIFISLLFLVFVLHLPCPLTASEPAPDDLELENLTPDEKRYHQCYVKCMEEGRWPCADKSDPNYECGNCIEPIFNQQDTTSKSDVICKKDPNFKDRSQAILNYINKRDEGTGIEVDTGTGQRPPADIENPPREADVGAEGNQANAGTGQEGGAEGPNGISNNYPSDTMQQSNMEVEIQQAEKNNGSVILLAEWQFILIVVGCVAVAIIGVAIAFICWYKIQTTSKAQNEADYPAYGVTGPGTQVNASMNNGDRKLAQSAQMYHYQHQKQQMIAMEKREKGDVARDASDYDSEEENEDGDLTVYECPGLAPTGEMQVKNPLFAEDSYPKQGGEEEREEKQ